MKKSKVLVFTLSIWIMLFFVTSCASANKPVQNENVRNPGVNLTDSDIESFDFGDPDPIPAQNRNVRPIMAASAQDTDYFQTGLASWYGREFNGKITASGERFDMNDSTAAHPTLPFGSIVEVTNLENGQTTRVRINDRGPFRASRIIDLSHYAANQIGLVEAGEGMVGINVIQRGNNAQAQQPNEMAQPNRRAEVVKAVNDDFEDDQGFRGAFTLQAGAFYSRRNAESLRERVENITNARARIANEGDFFKVRIDGISQRRIAERYREVLRQENIPSFIIENR
jgi:rare lipoprotein A